MMSKSQCILSEVQSKGPSLFYFPDVSLRHIRYGVAFFFFFFPECVERVKLSFAQYLPSASLADDAGCHQLSQNQTGGSKRTICT